MSKCTDAFPVKNSIREVNDGGSIGSEKSAYQVDNSTKFSGIHIGRSYISQIDWKFVGALI